MLKWLQFQQHKPLILVLNSLSMMNTAHHHHHHLHHSRLLLSSQPEPPSSNGSRAHNGLTSNEADFDTNMVIILAALLCALICALGLNSIVRCALRCTRRFTFESSGETAAAGLKKSTLRKLQVTVYGAGADMPATECPICLGEFCDGDKVRVLPRCHHGFHVRCIDVWLASHSSCPTCRQSLLEPCSDTVAGSGHDADAPISAEEVV